MGQGNKTVEVPCRELWDAAQEYRVRELAFWSCVNLIANAIGRCDFRTYRSGKEIREQDHYIWNYSPNVNQNSTAFWHKVVATLYQNNEVLIVPVRRRDGMDAYAAADDWQDPDPQVSRQNEYKGVQVGSLTFNKTFREEDVLHLTLNHCDVKPVLDGLFQSYCRLLSAAMSDYVFNNGQHWKVHVDQMARGSEGWEAAFQKMVEEQIRPFLTSNSAVLPEFDGYKYENMSKATDASRSAQHVKELVQDIFDFTANGFLIPPVLLRGEVQGTADAQARFLTACVDPIADQIGEEWTRKLYGYEGWVRGNYFRADTSAINHFDLFAHAPDIEKLIGSGYSYNDVQIAAGGQEIDEPWAKEHFLTKNFDLAMRILRGEETDSNGADSESGDGSQAAGG